MLVLSFLPEKWLTWLVARTVYEVCRASYRQVGTVCPLSTRKVSIIVFYVETILVFRALVVCLSVFSTRVAGSGRTVYNSLHDVL